MPIVGRSAFRARLDLIHRLIALRAGLQRHLRAPYTRIPPSHDVFPAEPTSVAKSFNVREIIIKTTSTVIDFTHGRIECVEGSGSMVDVENLYYIDQ